MLDKRCSSVYYSPTCIDCTSQMFHADVIVALSAAGGAGRDLPKFEFFGRISHRFTHNFTTTDKKFKIACYRKCKIILTENLSRCNLAPLLK